VDAPLAFNHSAVIQRFVQVSFTDESSLVEVGLDSLAVLRVTPR
jgi:aryl carrier-like protein